MGFSRLREAVLLYIFQPFNPEGRAGLGYIGRIGKVWMGRGEGGGKEGGGKGGKGGLGWGFVWGGREGKGWESVGRVDSLGGGVFVGAVGG